MDKTITAEELDKRLQNGEKMDVLDVREPFEVTAGKIPGAKNIPLSQLAIRKGELDKNKTYIVVCQSGNRSKAACGILEALGYNATDMIGGMNEWRGKLE